MDKTTVGSVNWERNAAKDPDKTTSSHHLQNPLTSPTTSLPAKTPSQEVPPRSDTTSPPASLVLHKDFKRCRKRSEESKSHGCKNPGPGTVKHHHGTRKQNGIPVGIAVAWQRHVTTSTTSSMHTTTTSSNTTGKKHLSPPMASPPAPKRKRSPVGTGPATPLGSEVNGAEGQKDGSGGKSKLGRSTVGDPENGSGSVDKSVLNSCHGDVKSCHGDHVTSSNSEGKSSNSYFQSGYTYNPYGDWTSQYFVPNSSPQQSYNAMMSAYLQQLSLHHHGHPPMQYYNTLGYLYANSDSGGYSPDQLHHYDRLVLHRQQEQLEQHHRLDYPTPVPTLSPRISIPSPSPNSQGSPYPLGGGPSPYPAPTTPWVTSDLYPAHHMTLLSSATLSPRSLASSTPSPITTYEALSQSYLYHKKCLTPTPSRLFSPPYPKSQAEHLGHGRPVSLVTHSRTVSPSPSTGPDSSVESPVTVSVTRRGSIVVKPEKLVDFTRMESLIEKRGESGPTEGEREARPTPLVEHEESRNRECNGNQMEVPDLKNLTHVTINNQSEPEEPEEEGNPKYFVPIENIPTSTDLPCDTSNPGAIWPISNLSEGTGACTSSTTTTTFPKIVIPSGETHLNLLATVAQEIGPYISLLPTSQSTSPRRFEGFITIERAGDGRTDSIFQDKEDQTSVVSTTQSITPIHTPVLLLPTKSHLELKIPIPRIPKVVPKKPKVPKSKPVSTTAKQPVEGKPAGLKTELGSVYDFHDEEAEEVKAGSTDLPMKPKLARLSHLYGTTTKSPVTTSNEPLPSTDLKAKTTIIAVPIPRNKTVNKMSKVKVTEVKEEPIVSSTTDSNDSVISSKDSCSSAWVANPALAVTAVKVFSVQKVKTKKVKKPRSTVGSEESPRPSSSTSVVPHHIKPCLKAEPVRISDASRSDEEDLLEIERVVPVPVPVPVPTQESVKGRMKVRKPSVDMNIFSRRVPKGSDTVAVSHPEEMCWTDNVRIGGVDEMINEMRVLTEIEGLFYTGKLNALQPPDVYGVTLDNERGAPPHMIFSAEEVLEKCIREAKPWKASQLPHGLRICAYWSPMYSGLYPGHVSIDYDLNSDLVPVEFDDGDTGVIKICEIRMLAPNHPAREYDPNPLLTLEKKQRKRRHSSSGGTVAECSGDHAEDDCGESYCAKVAKLDEDELEASSKLKYWTWTGLAVKQPKTKQNRHKEFFRGIQRGQEVINVGDSAIFISDKQNHRRPFLGRVENFWEKKGHKRVTVRWFYHPEEAKTSKKLPPLKYSGAVFESSHTDENDVQTIAKKCEVLTFSEYKDKYGSLYKSGVNGKVKKPTVAMATGVLKNVYYVAGFYDPCARQLKMNDLK